MEKGASDPNARDANPRSVIRMKLVTCEVRAMCGRRAMVSILAVVATCAFVAGCGNRRTPPPVQSIGSQQSGTEAPDQSASEGALADRSNHGSNDAGQPSADPFAVNDNTTVDRTQLVTVGPEDARRGSTIAGGGIITEPIKQLFLTQHRIEFIKVEHAENLYKGEHGRMPKSHEEYMQEIIQANEIELPELQAGWDYYYDAQSETLMQRKVN